NHVDMLSSTSRENVFQEMLASDVFVMPSIKETFGLVYLEALASGCIVIGSVNEGIDGVIKNNENGFLVNNGSVSEIVVVLEKIINMNVHELERVKNAGIKTSQNMSESQVARKYLENISYVINKRTGYNVNTKQFR
ncbi:glycosyltransferase family 4 protein, partial [Neobacillus vireti]|uniref:glycosyltransferase n=1 Tax=Neobacillus vireti TaxID=220686 RepID=UPI002FFF86A3